jgi:hypothetical protein
MHEGHVSVTFIDLATPPVYFSNFKQLMKEMVAASQQVIFRACPSKNQLARFSQPFRLMNQAATYLRQDPMGYHERAFDRFLPYSLDDDPITITEGMEFKIENLELDTGDGNTFIASYCLTDVYDNSYWTPVIPQ